MGIFPKIALEPSTILSAPHKKNGENSDASSEDEDNRLHADLPVVRRELAFVGTGRAD